MNGISTFVALAGVIFGAASLLLALLVRLERNLVRPRKPPTGAGQGGDELGEAGPSTPQSPVRLTSQGGSAGR